MDTAGKLTVQSLSAGALRAPLGDDERKSAHNVARCSFMMGKEHTLPSGSIVLGMASSDFTRLVYHTLPGSAPLVTRATSGSTTSP
jgi:hypothetical protein